MPSPLSPNRSDLPTGPTARHVFSLAWPMTLKAVILHGTVVIDAYLVASLGETALAAMGLAAAIAGFVLGAILAFAKGTDCSLSYVQQSAHLRKDMSANRDKAAGCQRAYPTSIAPATTTAQAINRLGVRGSPRNARPIRAAKITLVSRNAVIGPAGPSAKAATTAP